MTILKLLKLLEQIADAVKEYLRLKRIKDLKDAKNTALAERDNRVLEKALGGSAGPAADDKYPGMHNREHKEKSKD